MRIPDKVKILYKEYGIEEQNNLHNNGGDLHGQIHYLPEKILLNSESSQGQKQATLIHEIVHGLDEMYCIGLKERQVEKLGNAFYMLIRDNPQLFREGEQ